MAHTNKIPVAFNDDDARFVTVEAPAPYQGVGQALKSIYKPSKELPADMATLLDRLDRN